MWKSFLAALLLATIPRAEAGEDLQSFLRQTLTAAREKHHVPAIGALVVRDGRIDAEAAVGVRALGQPEPVTVDDRWHIGSDTKAFTATMIARLVERGVMGFDDTMAASFPAFAAQMDPAYRNVTVRQLLSHTAGLAPLTDPRELPAFFEAIRGKGDIKAQRAAVARAYLSRPPASKAGAFAYSNIGYVIAGAIAESRTGRSWEELMREQVFAPLGIRNAGFGPPGRGGTIDQPRGHERAGTHLEPIEPTQPDADNPPAMGPAGRINITLRDWSRFAQDQLEGELGGGRLLKPETYRLLHTPVTGNYALGWGALVGPSGSPTLLTHEGSNGCWLAEIRIWPGERLVQLVAINAGNQAANDAMGDVAKALHKRLLPAH